VAMWAVRSFRDSLLLQNKSGLVHQDTSQVSISTARQQVVPTVRIVTGDSVGVVVDQHKYDKFVQESISSLMEAQKEMEEEASRLLQSRLTDCFRNIHPRAEQFADWYFAYSTSFKLLQEATLSTARNVVRLLDPTPLYEAVATDMDRYLTTKYERIVLRPEINNSAMQAAYLHCVKDIHNKYTEAVSKIERGMIELLASETNHLEPPQANDIKLNLDWSSQLHKIKTIPANFEKNPELSLLLSTAGAVVGKSLASKGVGLASAKVLAGKLGAPFVSKAVAAGGGAVVGSMAGPLGTLFGATLGLGIDYSVDLGVEIVKREEFLKDVETVVEATKTDYHSVLEQELHRATRVWVEDAVQLLPRLAGNHSSPLNSAEQGLKHVIPFWIVSLASSFFTT